MSSLRMRGGHLARAVEAPSKKEERALCTLSVRIKQSTLSVSICVSSVRITLNPPESTKLCQRPGARLRALSCLPPHTTLISFSVSAASLAAAGARGCRCGAELACALKTVALREGGLKAVDDAGFKTVAVSCTLILVSGRLLTLLPPPIFCFEGGGGGTMPRSHSQTVRGV